MNTRPISLRPWVQNDRHLQMLNIAGLLNTAQQQLVTSPTPRLDAEQLLAHVLGKSRTWLHTWPEHVPDSTSVAHYRQLLQQSRAGVPLAYLTGSCGFWSLELKVTRDTLIPRADTETLIEWALELILPSLRCTIADLGTGSGAIALSLARERPACQITATDISAAALAVARENAASNRISNVRFSQGHWFAALQNSHYDLIVSNPPYVADADPHLQALQHEPQTALVAGSNGLADLYFLISGAAAHLHPHGWLLLEHGHEQGTAVRRALREHGYQNIATRRDPGGHERISGGQSPAAAGAGITVP